MPKREVAGDIKLRLRKALADAGFKSVDIEKMMDGREVSPEIQDTYKALLRTLIAEKRKEDDYEEGRWPGLDKL